MVVSLTVESMRWGGTIGSTCDCCRAVGTESRVPENVRKHMTLNYALVDQDSIMVNLVKSNIGRRDHRDIGRRLRNESDVT